MQQDPRGRIDLYQQIGQPFERAIGSAHKSAGDALRTADTHVRGRGLTTGELRMIRDMFGPIAGIERTRVFPFNFWWPYPNDRAMTPNGNMYYPKQDYRDDFSLPALQLRSRALFMHEATHLYQTYKLGKWLMVTGPFDRTYTYELQPGKKLTDYGIEQMGSIVEHYYILSHGGAVAGLRYSASDYRELLPVRA